LAAGSISESNPVSGDFRKVCASHEIADNDSKAFEVDGRSILICNTKDGFFAVDNICTHQLQELEGGKIRGCFIFCPLHGQRFNLKDGASIGQLTDKPLATFQLRIEGDDILINPQPVDGAPD
jgi:3-phenylpropionate/trans-cinnamate dioxygenase ferredoxin subunit